jgi:glycerophosphoryl diester phosphodiesterase
LPYAFQAAKACGATAIEIDVVLTAEGEPIVLHDRTLDRTTNGHGLHDDLAATEWRAIELRCGDASRERGGVP